LKCTFLELIEVNDLFARAARSKQSDHFTPSKVLLPIGAEILFEMPRRLWALPSSNEEGPPPPKRECNTRPDVNDEAVGSAGAASGFSTRRDTTSRDIAPRPATAQHETRLGPSTTKVSISLNGPLEKPFSIRIHSRTSAKMKKSKAPIDQSSLVAFGNVAAGQYVHDYGVDNWMQANSILQ
jgi:hypothetical protein